MLHINQIRIINAISILFTFLFTYTAISKLLDLNHFQTTLKLAPIIGSWAVPLSWTIIIAELLTVLLLQINILKLVGLSAAFIMMVAFTAYIALLFMGHYDLPCSCGGIIAQLSWKNHLVLNTLLLLLALLGLLLMTKQKNFIAINNR